MWRTIRRSWCNVGRETKRTRAICPACGERLLGGDKSICFIDDAWYRHIKFRKYHLVCWLASQDIHISTKEISQAKKMKILRAI